MIVCKLGHLMADRKLTMSKLAKQSGLHYMTVKKWFEDDLQRIDVEVLDTLCRYLGCQPCDLLVYQPSPGE